MIRYQQHIQPLATILWDFVDSTSHVVGSAFLITNNSLANRAGSELYVLDLARHLLERGHTPIAYSSRLGHVAECTQATIPVVDDLAQLATRPDIIHGHHHLDTMAALMSFPGVPAISFATAGCLGRVAAGFSSILRYVAVDHTCRDRVMFERGIPENKVRVILNGVDLRRFTPRPPLPARPRRVSFSNRAPKAITSRSPGRPAAIRDRARRDRTGGDSATAQPSACLHYHLVFAKSAPSLEAMAVGSAVILCGAAVADRSSMRRASPSFAR